MRIVVTGASGFIGKPLCKALVSRGDEVYGLHRHHQTDVRLSHERLLDLTHENAVKILEEIDPEIIIHLAADKTRVHPDSLFSQIVQNNICMTLNLITALPRLKNIKKCIMLGSAQEYGETPFLFHEEMRESPVSAYSSAKVCQTHLCQTAAKLYHIPFVFLRPSIVYGPFQESGMFIPDAIKSLSEDRVFEMTLGAQSRDFVHVSDVVKAILLSLECLAADNQIFNVGYGHSRTLSDVADIIGEALHKTHLICKGAKAYRACEMMHYHMDITKARTLLGFTPEINLNEGIRRLCHRSVGGDPL